MVNCEHLRIVTDREFFKVGDTVGVCCMECGLKWKTYVWDSKTPKYVEDEHDNFYHKVIF